VTINKHLSYFLNLMRLLATFFVVIDYLNRFTLNSGSFVFHQSYNSVIIFFVISVFLIGGGIINNEYKNISANYFIKTYESC